MHSGEYGLGIDIGDGVVAAAICRADDPGAEPVPLHLGAGGPGTPAAVELTGTGGVVLGSSGPDVPVVTHVMARVGTPAPLYAGPYRFPAAEVAAAVVRHVRSVAETQEGRPPSRTVIAIPASWGIHRSAVLVEALRSGGDVGDLSLVSGALTAAYHHVSTGAVPPRATVAIYDLGASTLDTAVVGPTSDGGLDHVAVPPPPLAWGGADIDDALLGHVLRSVDGLGDPVEGESVRARCEALRAQAVAAKEALSTETVAELGVGGSSLRVTREELDDLIDADVRASADALRATIAGAGRTAEDLHCVVLAGGAARTPLIGERLSAELGRPLVIGPEPGLTVALGAARLAADTLPATAVGTDADPSGAAPSNPDPTDPTDAADPEATGSEDAVPRTTRVAPPRQRGARRRTGGATRPPSSTGPHAPPPASAGRHANRVLVVAGMFIALVVAVPALGAVLSPSTGRAPVESVADAVVPTISPTPVPRSAGGGTGSAAFAGAKVQAVATSRSDETVPAASTKSSGTGAQETPASTADAPVPANTDGADPSPDGSLSTAGSTGSTASPTPTDPTESSPGPTTPTGTTGSTETSTETTTPSETTTEPSPVTTTTPPPEPDVDTTTTTPSETTTETTTATSEGTTEASTATQESTTETNGTSVSAAGELQ